MSAEQAQEIANGLLQIANEIHKMSIEMIVCTAALGIVGFCIAHTILKTKGH